MAVREHPFRVAWRTRDVPGWVAAMAPDVVIWSPIIEEPFRGRQAAAEVYSALFDVLDDVVITDELAAERTHVFYWQATIGDRTIEGADLVRADEHGQIAEIRVLIRPLTGIATFAAALGPALMATANGPRRTLGRALTAPLRPLFRVIDTVAARLAHHR